ncbi:MAG TPA: hypothetical protein VJ183_01075 [Chloroflexia bacterium]|nr:hypothetical protein [Chloroflexia bacterium]
MSRRSHSNRTSRKMFVLMSGFLCLWLCISDVVPSQPAVAKHSIYGQGDGTDVAATDVGGQGNQKSGQEEDGDQPRPPVERGTAGDLWADKILGQPDFGSVSPRTTMSNAVFWSNGTFVDKTGSEDRLYVYDSGNNRILGISNLEDCLLDFGACGADLVIGQPNFEASGCNHDSAMQNYPSLTRPTNETLCGQPGDVSSVAEGGSGASMDVDSEGNLYVADYYNNRVLKYEDPFGTDTIADDVWGQDNFNLNLMNRQVLPGINAQVPAPAANSLFFSWGESNSIVAGVDIDNWGNLWVADSGNNRVLRFPYDSDTDSIADTADVVFGQADFDERVRAGNPPAANRMNDPVVVRVNRRGWVYVSERGSGIDLGLIDRVLVFKPTKEPGPGSRPEYEEVDQCADVFERAPNTGNFLDPGAIEFVEREDGDDLVWIVNSGANAVNTSTKTVELWTDYPDYPISYSRQRVQSFTAHPTNSGSMGIDSSGNFYLTDASNWRVNVYGSNTQYQGALLPADGPYQNLGNKQTRAGMSQGLGIAVAGDQVIAADATRLLFWNNRKNLVNGQEADGEIPIANCCTALKYDQSRYLYIGVGNEIKVLDLSTPITADSQLLSTNLKFPFTLDGGGELKNIPIPGGFFGIAPSADGSLWLSHKETSRAFHVRNPLTNPTVDIVLGKSDPYGISRNYQPLLQYTEVSGLMPTTSNTLTKSTSGDNWDAGARSVWEVHAEDPWRQPRENVEVSIKVTSLDYEIAFGLNHSGTGSDRDEIDYSFVIEDDKWTGMSLKVRECNASNTCTVRLNHSVSVGQRLTIRTIQSRAKEVHYYLDNEEIWVTGTGQEPGAQYPLFFDSSIKTPGGSISDIKMGGLGIPALADTLSYPGALSFDRKGNLFLSDHSLEFEGNIRLLRFSGPFQVPSGGVLYAPSPKKIFPGLGTWEPAFDSKNHMVVGWNYSLYNQLLPDQSQNKRFPGYFVDPLSPSQNDPDGFLMDMHSGAFGATFDSDDNLYMTDLNRGRVLIYEQPRLGRPVRWVSPDDVTVTGNSIEKTGGNNLLWDAGAISDQYIMWGDGYVEVKADATDANRQFGLSKGDASSNQDDIDYSIRMGTSGGLYVYEGGTQKYSQANGYAIGDLLKVGVEGGKVRYYRNETAVYTSTALLTEAQYPLLVDASLLTHNGRIADVNMVGLNHGRVEWADVSPSTNITATYTSTSDYIERNSGTDGWNAGTSSTRTIASGEGYVQIKVDSTTGNRAFGLEKDNLNHSLNDIDFALVMTDNQQLKIYESGIPVGPTSTYTVGDYLKVGIHDGKAKYYRNNEVLYQRPISESITYPLRLDTSIYTNGARISNATISGNNLGDVKWVRTTENKVRTYANSIVKTTRDPMSQSLDGPAGAQSDRAILTGVGYAEVTVDAADLHDSRCFGLAKEDSDPDVGSIDYAMCMTIFGMIGISEGGTSIPGSFGTFAPGDVLKVAIEGTPPLLLFVNYYHNGVQLYSRPFPGITGYPLHLDVSLQTVGAFITDAYLYGADLTK